MTPFGINRQAIMNQRMKDIAKLNKILQIPQHMELRIYMA